MTQSCTIYCKVNKFRSVVELAKECGFSSMRADRTEKSVTIQGQSGSLQLNPKVFVTGGDPFSKLLLSTLTFAESIQSLSDAARQRLISHIEATQLIIGVVGEPDFDADERYHDVLFATARALGGLIFDGSDFFDADGRTIGCDSD